MNGNGHEEKGKRKSRLDRIEAAIELFIGDHEQFRQEHKRLLTAQVLLAEAQAETQKNLAELAKNVDSMAASQQKTDERLKELSEQTDARIAALTGALGELIRRMPLPPATTA